MSRIQGFNDRIVTGPTSNAFGMTANAVDTDFDFMDVPRDRDFLVAPGVLAHASSGGSFTLSRAQDPND